MKQYRLLFLFVVLMSMASKESFAYDIAVENADGVTIYYNYHNDGKELEVTYGSNYRAYSDNNYYSGNVVIPAEVFYMNRTRKVTAIGDNAFRYCSGLTSVTIPNSVTSIGDWAFFGCSGLISVTIPNSVRTIGDRAFANCDGLTSVTIPNSVTSIGDNAFWCCFGLSSVTIGNSVTSIGVDAFASCNGLSSVTIADIAAWCYIEFMSGVSSNPLAYAKHLYMNGEEVKDLIIPNSVTSIGDNAFNSCSGLTSVTIGNSVTSIGNRAFYGCRGLTSVTIPNSVTSIGDNAFEGCSGLTSVTISNGVTSIGHHSTFRGCKMSSVFSLIRKPFGIIGKQSNSRLFELDVFNNSTLFVPVGTIDKYKATDGWKDFLFIEEFDTGDVYTLSYVVDGVEFKTYKLGYGETITPEEEPTKEGYTFSGWSEIPETMPANDVIIIGTFTMNILGKCAIPSISYNNGKLIFKSETEDVIFKSTITDNDISTYTDDEIKLGLTYNISVYATKTGYEDSETATATLCWMDTEPKTEGITNVAQVRAMAVMIQSHGNVLSVSGADEGTEINVYDTAGRMVGSSVVTSDITNITTSLDSGNIAIIKIGRKAVKVLIK